MGDLSGSDFADHGTEIWRELLLAAKERYDAAACRLEEAVAADAGVPEARAHLLAARAEYLRHLRNFSDLILRGRRRGGSGQRGYAR